MNNLAYFLLFAFLVCCLLGLIFASKKTSSISPEARRKFLLDLNEQEDKIRSGNNSQIRDGIIITDTILTKVMQRVLHNDKSCGENLKIIRPRFQKTMYNKIWEAHKLRNQIVHDNYEPTVSAALQAFSYFKQFIIKLIN